MTSSDQIAQQITTFERQHTATAKTPGEQLPAKKTSISPSIFQAERHKCLTPVAAIRRRCIDCSGWSLAEVKKCWRVGCQLYPFRMGKRPVGTRPIKAIRSYCVDHCMNRQPKEVRLCTNLRCTLRPYRMGKRPKIDR